MRGGERGWGCEDEGRGWRACRGGNELEGLWKGYFEQLMNNEAEGEAVVTSMGIEAGRGRVSMQEEIDRVEVESYSKVKMWTSHRYGCNNCKNVEVWG